MEDATKYDKIINFFLNNWIIALVVLIAVLIAFIPSFRDGIIQVSNFFKMLFRKKAKDYVIEHQGETITFEYKTKSVFFDIIKINAITHHLGVSAEYQWIKKYYPNYRLRIQSLSQIEVNESQSLYFDTLELENERGQKKVIYFDISEFFNEGGHTSSDLDEFAKAKIKELYVKK